MTNDRQDDSHPRKAGATVAEERVPVVEERLTIGRETREGRTVSVRTRTVTEDVTLAEPVTRERISVERVPVGQVVEEVPPVREDGDLTVVPVVEERARVVVELVLTEEIHLRRHREQQMHEETVTLRRTEIDIAEDEG